MNRKSIILVILLCLICTVSAASAYDSFWDRVKETEVPAAAKTIKEGLISSHNSEIPKVDSPVSKTKPLVPETTQVDLTDAVRTEGYFRLESLELAGETDESTAAVLKAFNGLQFNYAAQTGSIPMSSFDISMGQMPVFTYEIQATNPYIISSNLFGAKPILIAPEDQFEEKLAAALYNMIGTMSEDNSNLPDLESIYTVIRSIREASEGSAPFSMSMEFSFDQELNLSAFESIMMKLMMRLEETDKTTDLDYLYTDIPQWNRKFTWPRVNSLPDFASPVSAITGTFTDSDLLEILNALTKFFADNPEFTEMLNSQIKAGLVRSNPELAKQEDTDFLNELVGNLKESVETDLKDTWITVTVNQDESGSPTLITVETGKTGQTENDGAIFYFHNTADGPETLDNISSVVEVAADTIHGQQRRMLFRGLIINNENYQEGNGATVNFLYDDEKDTKFEYYQTTNSYLASTMTKVTESKINFDLNGELGYANISGTSKPNRFNGEDTTIDITYEHTSQGKPLFTANFSGVSKNTEPQPGFDTVDVITASEMTDTDYNQLVSGIFGQLMMLMMNFM